jgi:hypothetical protein
MRELLLQAVASEHGLVVHTPEPLRLRQKLYSVKKEDVSFICLSFVLSPTDPDNELWIVKRDEIRETL